MVFNDIGQEDTTQEDTTPEDSTPEDTTPEATTQEASVCEYGEPSLIILIVLFMHKDDDNGRETIVW